MIPAFPPISEDLPDDPPHFDVIVVGSGYGGGVAASRLARCGKSVAVLERGREIRPGEYPRDMASASEAFQTTLSGDTIGDPQNLFDLRIYDDLQVLVGCGLGGTSLINANVAIEPDPWVFDAWAQPEEGDWPSALHDHMTAARQMLGSTPYPEGKTTPKLQAMERVAAGLGQDLHRPDINVTFKEGHTAAGLWQAACTDCGDCVTGCNYGAKNTVLMNYLPDAHAFGARLFTGARVASVARQTPTEPDAPPVWQVSLDADDRVLTADVVILAAGTLGSTEILLRSAQNLPLSAQLGAGFSGNGDTWSLGFNANMPDEKGERLRVHAVGAGRHDVPMDPAADIIPAWKPGPCITGMIHMRRADPKASVMVQEGVIPGAFAPGYAVGIPGLATLESDPFRFGDMAMRARDMQKLAEDVAADPAGSADTVYDGPVSRTLPFLTFAHDAAAGQMSVEEDRFAVTWAGAGKDPALVHTDHVLRQACDAIQAEYMPFLTSLEPFGNRTMVVHPLGGCAIGASAQDGVVNTDCQVFDGQGGLHEGLYVMDGAVVPTALGANPHLTITALAERAVARLAGKRSWEMDTSAAPRGGDLAVKEPTDFIEVLDDAIAGLTAIKAAIDGKSYELAEMLLLGFWRQVREAAQEMVDLPSLRWFRKTFCKQEVQIRTTGPLVGYILDMLVPLRDALVADDMVALKAHIDNEIGDVSPSARFPETMAGHVSPIGVDDPVTDFDPHALLGDDAWPCTLSATLSCDAIQSLMTDPVGAARMCDGKFICPGLGGTFDLTGNFRFLACDEDAVDRWRVTYDGQLEQEGGPTYRFEGRKTLEHRDGSHWWRDLTDLNVDIYDDPAADTVDAPPIARGRMKVTLEAAIRQAVGFDVSYTDLAKAPERVLAQIKDAMDHRCLSGTDVSKLPDLFQDRGFRVLCVKAALHLLDQQPRDKTAKAPSKLVAALFKGLFMARAAGLVFRTYGGIYAYAMDFPAQDLANHPPVGPPLPEPEFHYPEPEPGVFLKLTRYKRAGLDPGAVKGPVMLANGFGVKASAFAVPTTDRNLVEMLVEADYDVWLFDYRGSGDAAGSSSKFTIDDVAQADWPAAIAMVLDRTRAKDVQVVAHCVGALSLFMAVLAGETRIRSIIASQVGAHGIVNWFKNAQFDADMGSAVANGLPEALWPVLDMMNLEDEIAGVAKAGLPLVDVRSGHGTYSPTVDAAFDALLWSVPHFAEVPCKNPTCHRINFVYGPTYRHENLNQATHAYISEMFGAVSSTPFLHLALMFDTGRLMSARIMPDGTVAPDGVTDYYAGHANFSMPVHFIAGARNAEILPEATLRTHHWLQRVNERSDLYTRHVYPDYGHMDCFVGRTAWRDIFPDLIARLDRTARPNAPHVTCA